MSEHRDDVRTSWISSETPCTPARHRIKSRLPASSPIVLFYFSPFRQRNSLKSPVLPLHHTYQLSVSFHKCFALRYFHFSCVIFVRIELIEEESQDWVQRNAFSEANNHMLLPDYYKSLWIQKSMAIIKTDENILLH